MTCANVAIDFLKSQEKKCVMKHKFKSVFFLVLTIWLFGRRFGVTSASFLSAKREKEHKTDKNMTLFLLWFGNKFYGGVSQLCGAQKNAPAAWGPRERWFLGLSLRESKQIILRGGLSLWGTQPRMHRSRCRCRGWFHSARHPLRLTRWGKQLHMRRMRCRCRWLRKPLFSRIKLLDKKLRYCWNVLQI